jgi:hypothetical protein
MGKQWLHAIDFFSHIRLGLCLLVFELFHLWQGGWYGDFWEHAAVIKALMADLIAPHHPILSAAMPHAFFSPYTLLVAGFARVTHLNSVNALSCFGFLNLLLLLWSLWQFCQTLFDDSTISKLSIFFIFFLWGYNPLYWSGFIHMMTLHYVLPYPSTFAFGLSLWILSRCANQSTNAYWDRLVNIFLSTIVLITHPTTAVFLYVSCFGIHFWWKQFTLQRAIFQSAMLFIGSFLLSLSWPYYDFLSLFLCDNSDFHKDSQRLYTDIWSKNYPFLLLFPIFRLESNKIIRFLLGTISILILIYGLGFVFHWYGFGRVISNIMLLAHIGIAYWAVRFARTEGSAKVLKILLIALFCSLLLNIKKLGSMILFFPKNEYQQYAFLRKWVDSDAIILSDEETNWHIPAFGGRVIASIHPLYWVSDMESRRKCIKTFFADTTSNATRQNLLMQYKPNYILIDSLLTPLNTETMQWIAAQGTCVYQKNTLKFIKTTF